MTDHESRTTTDHDEIRRWAEARDGRPASVEATAEGDDPGILRIDFGEKEDSLQEISWDDWFPAFEDNKLAFLYQEQTKDGGEPRFFKLVSR